MLQLYRRNPTFYNRTISEPVFRHYFGDDLDAFDRDFKAFARQLVGIDPPTGSSMH
jgi:hypothetical protein